MRNILLFSTLFCFYLNLFCQVENSKLKVYTFSEVEKLRLQNPKPIVVFVYTDWFKVCFAMKQKTLKNKEIINMLNHNFYFTALNAEENKNIFFEQELYINKKDLKQVFMN